MTDRPAIVSFIIPHKGREELLQMTLASIASQDFDSGSIEVVLVTQNDVLSPVTLSAAGPLRLAILERPATDVISKLRNVGAQGCSGQYLAFLDADVELAPNWIRAMLAELQASPGRVLVSAMQKCADSAPELERIRTVLSNAVVDSPVRFLPGRNLLLRRDTFLEVGGFPEHLVTCEDYYFTDKVHDLGELYYSAASWYVHLGEDREYGAMFRKEIWRGQSNLQSIRGRRIPLAEWPSFLVPLWILAFAVLALLALLTSRPWALLVLAGLSIFPVLLYAWRLHRIAGGSVGFGGALRFYATYFPARIIGTLSGIFRPIASG